MELCEGARNLYEDIAAFRPFNEQEAADKEVILQALEADPHVAERSAQAHLACSVWTVDPAFEQTLLVYHDIYDSWSWIGGHADGELDLAAVALRELEEETGVHGRLVPCDGGAALRRACGQDAESALACEGVEGQGALRADAPGAKAAARPGLVFSLECSRLTDTRSAVRT